MMVMIFVPHLNGLKTLTLPTDVYMLLNESYPDAVPVVQNLHLSLHVQERKRILPFLPRVTKSIHFTSLQYFPEELSLSSTIEELSFENCYEIGKISSPLPNLRVVKSSKTVNNELLHNRCSDRQEIIPSDVYKC